MFYSSAQNLPESMREAVRACLGKSLFVMSLREVGFLPLGLRPKFRLYNQQRVVNSFQSVPVITAEPRGSLENA